MTRLRDIRQTLRPALIILILASLASGFIILAPEQSHYVLLLVAITLILSGLGALLQQRTQRDWDVVPAILHAVHEAQEKVAHSPYGSLTYFYPVVRFGYTFGGHTYTGTMAAREKEGIWVPEVNAWGDPTPRDARWWLTMQPGQSIVVYVNPLHPDEAVIVNAPSSNRRSHHHALLIAGLLLALAWIADYLTGPQATG